MTAILVDSNILLDVITEDVRLFSWSANALERAADSFRLAIKASIYAEISGSLFANRGPRCRPSRSLFEREAIPYEAAFPAGKCFVA